MASVNASHDDDDDAPVDSINITPLVDVLMVVLVMFILTATAQVSGIQIHLPKASASVSLSEAKTKAISVKRRSLTNVIDIDVTSADPKQSARIANALVDVFRQFGLDERMQTASQDTSWLDTRLKELHEDVVTAESADTDDAGFQDTSGR